MRPIEFKQANRKIIGAVLPNSEDPKDYGDLHVFFDNVSGTTTSLWKPETEDIKAILEGGAIAFRMQTPGGQHPPVAIMTAVINEEISVRDDSDEEPESNIIKPAKKKIHVPKKSG